MQNDSINLQKESEVTTFESIILKTNRLFQILENGKSQLFFPLDQISSVGYVFKDYRIFRILEILVTAGYMILLFNVLPNLKSWDEFFQFSVSIIVFFAISGFIEFLYRFTRKKFILIHAGTQRISVEISESQTEAINKFVLQILDTREVFIKNLKN